MSQQKDLISSSSTRSLAPFNNYDPNEKPSWLCFLCGRDNFPDEQAPIVRKKQKIPLSKVSKTTKHINFRSVNNQQQKLNLKVGEKDKNRLSLKSSNGQRASKLAVNEDEPLHNYESLKVITQSQPPTNSSVKNSISLSQCNVQNLGRFSIGNQSNYSRGGQQILSVPMVQSIRNNSREDPPSFKSSTNIGTTDYGLNRKSLTFVYQNPSYHSFIQEKSLIHKQQIKTPEKVSFVRFSSPVQLVKDNSEKNLYYYNDAQQSYKNNSIKIQPKPNHQVTQVSFIQEIKSPKLKSKKSKSSNSTKGLKFLKNARKASSRSQMFQSLRSNPIQACSSFGQLNSKMRIAIKKVQSFDSHDEDEDQYSEVLSHGQRSFLMTQINEVSQVSKISSASRFKIWNDSDKNPQY